MPGRIRIEVDGLEVDNKQYYSNDYREKIINKALAKYKKITVIISPDEQPQKRPIAFDSRRGVHDIIDRRSMLVVAKA
jgi:hypothetical protein